MFQPACVAESAPSLYACLVCPAPRLCRSIARLWSRATPVRLDRRMRPTDEAFDLKSANRHPWPDLVFASLAACLSEL